jgi:taurine dioxygenase
VSDTNGRFSTDMELRLLHATIGAEVLGVDLSSGIELGGGWSRADIDEMRTALDDRHLLLVRGPVLTGEAQVAFVGRFGPLIAERQLWGYVSNVRPDGIVREGALLFHSDFAFAAEPLQAISLHPLDVPADGAPTLFADAVAAVGALPADLRARLDGRRVVNVYDFGLPDDRPMRIVECDPRSPRHEHPLIGRHPRTGAEVIMANELHTDHIVGLPRAESDALLADLFAVVYDDANILEHRWSVGDLVLWDNIALHHGRRDIPRDEPRTLQRVTLGSYRAAELVPNLADLLATRPAGTP